MFSKVFVIHLSANALKRLEWYTPRYSPSSSRKSRRKRKWQMTRVGTYDRNSISKRRRYSSRHPGNQTEKMRHIDATDVGEIGSARDSMISFHYWLISSSTIHMAYQLNTQTSPSELVICPLLPGPDIIVQPELPRFPKVNSRRRDHPIVDHDKNHNFDKTREHPNG